MMQIKKRWTTDAGYEAVVLWVRDSHHCGYVRVPENHPFYKKRLQRTLRHSFMGETS